MGRLNKRLQAKKAAVKDNEKLSKSSVLKTLAVQDKKGATLPKTFDELKKQVPDFELLLAPPPTSKQIKAESETKLNKIQGNSSGKVTKKLSKKDKMKLRKDNLQKKLHVLKLVKEEEIAKAKRQKKAITGDLKPMADTLDELLEQDLEKKKKKANEKKAKRLKGTPKQKKVQDQMLKDMAIFNQVISHPQYSSDPFNTISTHIENKMLMEAMSQD